MKAFRATLDPRYKELILALSHHHERKPNPLIANFILQLRHDKPLAAKFVQFARDFEDSQAHSWGKYFMWEPEIHTALEYITWKQIKTGNKSKTIRLIVSFFARQFHLDDCDN
jgi:hypothetical protein